jgi:hypothetical protein
VADHEHACHWITVAIILHNLIIDVEGLDAGAFFSSLHGLAEEQQDRGGQVNPLEREFTNDEGELKQIKLTVELLAHHGRL